MVGQITSPLAHHAIGWRCAVCGATVDIAEPFPWRCPAASTSDRHHALHLLRALAPLRATDDPNPFVAYDSELAWAAFAAAHGMTDAARAALVAELDAAVAVVDGSGFRTTPFERSDHLSETLGFTSTGGVWVKDETGGVSGSHKSRHLVTILLHLRAAELLGMLADRPPLAIASCGNAALAAATLAKAVDWPIEVYVPTWMDDAFGARLDALGATIHRCERRTRTHGDPAVQRFREAVDAGAVPFSVQGPENALCLDGARTIAWEMNQVLGHTIDRLFVQVGGGALVSALGSGYAAAGVHPRIHAVQAEGCAPLARAWARADGATAPGTRWDELMTPWDDPHSAADGILDDETYDWLGAFDAMRRGGGEPVVATEAEILAAHELATAAGYQASVTGSAGLAGLLAIGDRVDPGERVAVLMTGVAR